MKLDLNLINAEIELGNVNKQVHPTLPLAIYKYSQQAVFTRAWNEITLRCRGVVLDEQGEIVINGFGKFFNHSEQDGQATYANGKLGPYVVTEKLDGSLIQVALYQGKLVIASSGSFSSPQAQKAAEFFRGDEYNDLVEEGKSYLFELIYPQNRIIINYGDLVRLTLLAIRDTATGLEYSLDLKDNRVPVVKTVNMTLEEIEAELDNAEFINKEGYIALFADGSRVKMKYDRYCELHKVISGLNELSIWDNLSNDVNVEEALSHIPDELFDYVKTTVADLKSKFDTIDTEAKSLYSTLEVLNFLSRKEQAAWLMAKHKDMASLVFCMLDKKPYADKIWKMIRPVYAESKKFGRGES